MKTIKLYVTGVLAAFSLALTCMPSQAQYVGPTNFIVYNFDNCCAPPWPPCWPWQNWSGNDCVSAVCDPTTDASNNPNSGSLKLTVNNGSGCPQWVLMDGFAPYYTPVPLVGVVAFTNLFFDMKYDVSSAIRTNANGSLDFGLIRAGSKGQPGANWGQEWYYYWAIPATNGPGNPNTNWIRVNIDLRPVPGAFPDLGTYGLDNIMYGADNSTYNPTLVGQQIIWFDNIGFSGYVAPLPPPTLSIERARPALRMFGGSSVYGRSQVALVDTNESWVGGTFPVTYAFTILDNANSPGNLDTHIQIIGGGGDASYLDWGANNVLWLRIVSGTAPSTTCIADISWKTNYPDYYPNEGVGGHVALMITNPVLAGTWTLTFLSDTNGTVTAPGAAPVPFSIALSDADAVAAFSPPIQVRFGHENFGNAANGGVPHDWANITVSGTAGTQINEDFTKEGTNQLDTTIWDLNTSDGVNDQVLVPTNAPYWVKWTTPDTNYNYLETATNLSGPWKYPEYYNNYADGTNPVATQIFQGGQRWNLMMPYYLPTANGLPGGPLSPYAFFRLTVATNAPPGP